ncbi:unnamed protein product [Tilletia controversa]|uniref:Uncharacterized protein n=3 Tax=Tilletia TaxID=13289 RepID=A0A8X7SSH8_9BASI|nr:hypothetical protein CF336_g8414 [Tilletia laevis]KAE8183498.1 hypothetical protein CF328_g8163 [Tilletia controversa]CAD6949095.1 unnamed protein product [Tilletia caries]KAE8184226.1 hypothetical protein CF335_g8086 [Tilletia laevis]KAE8237460.1 hypothetical protein A4X06_0g9223 [Tilletia controversa]
MPVAVDPPNASEVFQGRPPNALDPTAPLPPLPAPGPAPTPSPLAESIKTASLTRRGGGLIASSSSPSAALPKIFGLDLPPRRIFGAGAEPGFELPPLPGTTVIATLAIALAAAAASVSAAPIPRAAPSTDAPQARDASGKAPIFLLASPEALLAHEEAVGLHARDFEEGLAGRDANGNVPIILLTKSGDLLANQEAAGLHARDIHASLSRTAFLRISAGATCTTSWSASQGTA